MRPLLRILALIVAISLVDPIFSQPDPPFRVHFDSFQLDRRYADIALVGAVSLNATFYIQGGTLVIHFGTQHHCFLDMLSRLGIFLELCGSDFSYKC